MAEQRTAVVAGATGLVGRHLVEQLLEDASVAKVVVVTRRSLRMSHSKLKEFMVDIVDEASWVEQCKGADVFCALGTTLKKAGSIEKFRKVDHDLVLRFAQIALRGGARSFFLVSSIGANAKALLPYARTKGEVEEALKEMKFPRLVLVRPSLLVGEREETRFSERAIAYLSVPLSGLFRGSFEKYRPIEAMQVARAMSRLARDYELGMRIIESDELGEIAQSPYA